MCCVCLIKSKRVWGIYPYEIRSFRRAIKNIFDVLITRADASCFAVRSPLEFRGSWRERSSQRRAKRPRELGEAYARGCDRKECNEVGRFAAIGDPMKRISASLTAKIQFTLARRCSLLCVWKCHGGRGSINATAFLLLVETANIRATAPALEIGSANSASNNG